MNNKVIVMDFDDVLVDFSQAMYKYIRCNWRVFQKWFGDKGNLTTEEIQSRKLYNMNEWLILTKFQDLTSEEYVALQQRIFKEFENGFFNSDIYAYLEPTEFARKTLMNTIYIDDKLTKHVYIVSRNVTQEQSDSKERFIERYFNHPKITYINVEKRESKANALKNRNINFDVFIDDEIPNIRDIAEKFGDDLDKKEFIIPKYGYNKMPPELQYIIEEKGGIITYFNPFKK